MSMTIQEYVAALNRRYKTGIATEHSYRADLQALLSDLLPKVEVTNEPRRSACGAPDFILTRKNIPIGYIEAKDIGKSLDNKLYREQFDRYRHALQNLVITDYLEFRFYREGDLVTSLVLAEMHKGKVVIRQENVAAFADLMQDFGGYEGQTIGSASKLSKMMAAKARLLADVLEKALDGYSDENNGAIDEASNTLYDQLKGFRDVLIHDITPKQFGDIYAQTIAYGMFAARLHDPTLENFNRKEAAELIPKTNPFLRKLFQYIAGYDLDDRLVWIVDALADIFKATDVNSLLKDFRNATQQNDPIIHFYETFLAEYDPTLRKSRGVWYTPEPVVNFIVRAVDDILKTEFDLRDGLTDTSKITVEIDKATTDKNFKSKHIKQKQEVHKVQILDPAVGTGTFLAEIIKHIHKQFEGQEGMWNNYVSHHLIPRLNGFEILMASYAMAHLKLDLLLAETGYTSTTDQRFRVFLTNSLEEHHPETGTLFASWLSQEANEANYIKRDTPVMVVLGNPPYSGHSANKSKWIEELLRDYKQEPNGGKLQEKNPKWLNDDYVKFIRYGQYFVEKNGEGILGFINNHSFLDNPTFRGMRWHLLSTFDAIYLIDLHGNAKKKEACPDGSSDKNVFDIQQGVSINLFVKTGKKKKGALAEVFHYDVYGDRPFKYDFLSKKSLSTVDFTKLTVAAPNYLFVPKDFSVLASYNQGFAINELFSLNSVGIVTARDRFVIDSSKLALTQRIKNFFSLDKDELLRMYGLKENSAWRIHTIKQSTIRYSADFIQMLAYRPFDNRYVYYDPLFIERSRSDVMKHFLQENIVLTVCRQVKAGESYHHVFLANKIFESCLISNKTSEIGYGYPLYRYLNINNQIPTNGEPQRIPNLNAGIVNQIAIVLGLTFTPEKEETDGTFAPIDILDYIYAVLHSPAYREKYKEFLKIDFPCVPYPQEPQQFWQLVALGSELRQLHLLESPTVEQRLTSYPIAGNDVIEKITYLDGKVYINEKQYFEGVPLVAWEFYIGGYQPAQKWLKDRKGMALCYDDVRHYQRIIIALTETARIMEEIDTVGVE
uniref:site-specific DNA-methyltransferase (adenine-specific) n=1 Tax=Chlorobium chlorochromatii (strain CaD3) TaxID=340177 RepID=Q3ARB7_CHLCH